jgi:poly(A) polymerase
VSDGIPSDAAAAALRRAVLVALGHDPGLLLAPSAADYATLEPELVRREVEHVLMGRDPAAGLQRLHDDGALVALLPEVAALVGFGEGDRRHKDVWDHSKRVVSQSPLRVEVRWAALLHDIGKVPTRTVAPDGQVQFHGHAEVGARAAARVLKRLGFDKDQGNRIRQLVLYHQRPSQYDPGWTDAAVRRFAKETGDLLGDLLALSRADMTTRYDARRQRGRELIDELARRVAEVREIDARVPPLPKGLGLGIMERFGLPPGPLVGRLRAAVEAAVDRGELEPQQDAEVYLAWLAVHLDELKAQ